MENCGVQTLSKKYTFSPAELSSERGEKEVLADSTQLGGAAAAINAVARELLRSACLPGREKMAPEGISSTTGRALLQSMLVSADDSCHCQSFSVCFFPKNVWSSSIIEGHVPLFSWLRCFWKPVVFTCTVVSPSVIIIFFSAFPLVVPRGWRCRNPCLGKALDGTCAVATGPAPGGEGGDQAAAQEAIDGGGT